MAALLTLSVKKDDGSETLVCQDAYVTDNELGVSVTKGGIVLKPHSIYVCVAATQDQASQQAIGRTIFNKKPPGCDMNGDQSVVIADQSGLYSTPPTYTIRYSYALNVSFKVRITLARPQFLPSDAQQQIRKAIYGAFTGNDGSQRPRIGSEILASGFYGPVQKLGSWIHIITLFIGRNMPDQTLVQMNINEMPVLTLENIEVIFNG